MEIKQVSSQEILEVVNPKLREKGWAPLNVNEAQPTNFVLGAYEGGRLLEIIAFQLFPIVGPLLRIEGKDGGQTTRILAESMKAFLEESGARGYLAIADSPFTERICKRLGMSPLESPVFSFVAPEKAQAQGGA